MAPLDILSVALGVLLLVALALALYTARMPYTLPQKLIFTLGGGSFMLLALWHGAVRLTLALVEPYIEPAKLDAARAAAGRLQVSPYWELGALALFGAYWFAVHVRRALDKFRADRRG